MNYIQRYLNLTNQIANKSFFLLGPRQTGKSLLLSKTFSDSAIINLLKSDELFRYQKDPALLRREFESHPAKIIIIDEVQKLPSLLDEVHYLIERCHHKFILTGSSARKLKKSGNNLLGGRASLIALHPMVREELKNKFNLTRALNFGLLPSVYFSKNPAAELKDYVSLYLKEEIMAEGLTRNLPAFSRFLEVAAQMNGKMINYTKIANDAQVAPTTTYEYFKVLQDTLIATEVLAFAKTNIRKAISTSKFYFFDLGVVRSILRKKELDRNDDEYGHYFEAYIFHELNSYTSYRRLSPLKYWRSKSNFEVDFILDDRIAIEVKSSQRVQAEDLKGLVALAEEKKLEKYYLISNDKKNQIFNKIKCIYWEDFLDLLYADQI